MDEIQSKSLAEFLARWPVEKVEALTLEQYTKAGSRDSFTYWLEARTDKLGSIWGGTSFKFGIYDRKSSVSTENHDPMYGYSGNFAWYSYLGNTPDEVFAKVKSSILGAIAAAKKRDLPAIDALGFSPSVQWKIAFLYQDFSNPCIIPIFAVEALRYLAFGTTASKEPIAACQSVLGQRLPTDVHPVDFSQTLWQQWNQYWKSIQGLMASDSKVSVDQARFDKMSEDTMVTWWSKQPSKGDAVASQLRELLNKEQSFPFYFTSAGKVEYRARVIDFSSSKDYPEKAEAWKSAKDWKANFTDYTEGNHSAKIAFLIDSFEKLASPIPTKAFSFWNGLASPTQDNLQAFVSIGQSEEAPHVSPASYSESTPPAQNRILYGPPGTGKTYNTVNHALAILDHAAPEQYHSQNRDKLQDRFRHFQAQGRIGFITFHPSFAYEDFVEGIKPVSDETYRSLRYTIEPGLFKRMCIEAAYEYYRLSEPDQTKSSFDNIWDTLISQVSESLSNGNDYPLDSRSGRKMLITDVSDLGNFTIKHEGSTADRDYIVSRQRLRKLWDAFPDLGTIANINDSFRSVIGGSNTSAYWSVLSKLRSLGSVKMTTPVLPATTIALEEKTRKIANLQWDQIDLEKLDVPRYVLVIDEINRGNIPAILGELITLIEDNKRAGRSEAISLILPYSKDSFTVPPNLFILGTMNTADRSVEGLDAALRRRFTFVEQMPNPELLNGDIDGINLRDMLVRMNQRLERLLDRDHTIGHALLMNVQNLSELRVCFKDKILPQLQEYFYGDWRKIGMVIGPGFIQRENLVDQVAWPRGYEDEDHEAHDFIYRITDPEAWSVSAFQGIYE